jgi:ubiquinone biosynthesis protein
VCFLDFGAVGHVTRRRAERIMHLIHGFTYEDLEEVTQALLEICNIYGPVDANVLRRDVERIMDYAVTERAAVGDPVIMDLIAKTATRNHMLLPPDFFLISRALFQFEGICTRMDPDYDMVQKFTPVIIGHLRREALSQEGFEALKEPAMAYAEMLRTMPGRINSLLRKMENNQLELRVHAVNDHGPRDERRAMQRSFTALVGALIVGAGLTLLSPYADAMSSFLFFGAMFTLLWGFVMLYYSE